MAKSEENITKPVRWTNTVKITKYVKQKSQTEIHTQRQEVSQVSSTNSRKINAKDNKWLIFQRIFNGRKGRHLLYQVGEEKNICY